MEAVCLQGSVQPDCGMLLLMSGSTLAPGNNLEGGGRSLAIKEKCQLLPFGEGEDGSSCSTCSIQPDSGMLLLLMSGSTLQPGSSPEGGGGSLAIKEKCQLLPYKGVMVEAVGLHGTAQPGSGMLLLMSGSTPAPGKSLEGGDGAVQ